MREKQHTLPSAIGVRDFGAEPLRPGDLDGDGAPDLRFVLAPAARASGPMPAPLAIPVRSNPRVPNGT